MSVADVVDWLRSLQLGAFSELYASAFEGAGIDCQDALVLDEDSLCQLGVLEEAHRRKILRSVQDLPQQPSHNQYSIPSRYRLAELEVYGDIMRGHAREAAEEQVQKLQRRLQDAESRAQSAETEASTSARNASAVEEDLRQQNADLAEQLEDQQQEAQGLRDKNAELNQKLVDAESRISQLHATSSLEKQQADQQLRQQLDDYEEQLEASRQTCNDLQDELDQANQTIAALKEGAQDDQAEVQQRYEDELQRLQEELDEARQECSALEAAAAAEVVTEAAPAATQPTSPISALQPPADKSPAVLPELTQPTSLIAPLPSPQPAQTHEHKIDNATSPEVESPISILAQASQGSTPAASEAATKPNTQNSGGLNLAALATDPTETASEGVDNIADKQRLTQLYQEHNPQNVSKIDGILEKYNTLEKRKQMWLSLEKKYPNFFQDPTVSTTSPLTTVPSFKPLSFSGTPTSFQTVSMAGSGSRGIGWTDPQQSSMGAESGIAESSDAGIGWAMTSDPQQSNTADSGEPGMLTEMGGEELLTESEMGEEGLNNMIESTSSFGGLGINPGGGSLSFSSPTTGKWGAAPAPAPAPALAPAPGVSVFGQSSGLGANSTFGSGASPAPAPAPASSGSWLNTKTFGSGTVTGFGQTASLGNSGSGSGSPMQGLGNPMQGLGNPMQGFASAGSGGFARAATSSTFGSLENQGNLLSGLNRAQTSPANMGGWGSEPRS